MSRFIRFRGDQQNNARMWLEYSTVEVTEAEVARHFHDCMGGDRDNCVVAVVSGDEKHYPLALIYVEDICDFERISNSWQCLGWRLVDGKDLFNEYSIRLV